MLCVQASHLASPGAHLRTHLATRASDGPYSGSAELDLQFCRVRSDQSARKTKSAKMGSVNNQALLDKLHNLNSTQQSIETVSAWCSFYRKDARKVVSVWEQEFVKMPMPKQLAMAYLANDILQNSRKKGPEFVHEFHRTLPRAVKHMLKHGDDKVKRAINRLVDIWEDRKASLRMKVLAPRWLTVRDHT